MRTWGGSALTGGEEGGTENWPWREEADQQGPEVGRGRAGGQFQQGGGASLKIRQARSRAGAGIGVERPSVTGRH